MSRRVVPGTFWVGILLSVVLLGHRVWAAMAPDRVPNLVGHWDGFFQDPDSLAIGLVRSDINSQVRGIIQDHGLLLNSQGRVLIPHEFRGMVSGEDSITGTGQSPLGGVVYQADLATFAGAVGDAGVQFAGYEFVPRSGLPKVVNAIVLHPFLDADAPDVSGAGKGYFASQNTTGFGGKLEVMLAPRDNRGAFPGRVMFVPQQFGPGAFPSCTWDLRATTSGPNPFVTPSGASRFVMIAQGEMGYLVADAVILPPLGGGYNSSYISGLYNLQLIDGRTDFGIIEFLISRKSAASGPKLASVKMFHFGAG